MHLVVVVVALLSGCIISKDECNESGKTGNDTLANVQPGIELRVTLNGCSTCGHAKVNGTWTRPSDPVITGSVDVTLSPVCPVQDTTVKAAPDDGHAVADNNHKNCGDVVDYDGYLKNNSNVVIPMMEITMTCCTLGE